METIIGAGVGGADLIKESSADDFVLDVIEASRETPVIVDFWAEWCEPCKQLTPGLEKAVRQAGGRVRLVKIDVDKNQQLAAQLKVQSLPTVMAFVNGQPVDAFQGALPESQISAFIDKLGRAGGPTGLDQIVELAQAAMEAGDYMSAIEGFGQAAKAEPGNLAALGGLARCYVALGKMDEAESVLGTVPTGQAGDAAIEGARAALELARAAGDVGDSAALSARIEADGTDLEARYQLSLGLAVAGDNEAAADQLLEIIRQEREWNEDAARQQLIKLFNAAGHMHPFTIATRRKLSTMLFS